MRLAFSRLAERDLEAISDYIATENPRRALTFVRELRRHIGNLAAAPLAWPERPEIGSGIRSGVHGRYAIFFSIGTDRILVLRVLHGARDLADQFGATRD